MRLVVGEQRRHRVGGDRRQQDAVAEVAGRDDEARACWRDGAEDGAVVAGARAAAGARLGQDELADRGDRGHGVAEQVMDGAGGDVAVVALLLGGADDELAVGAGDQVDVAALDDRADRVADDVRQVTRVPQPQDLALDRADGLADLVGHALDAAGAPAGGDDHVSRRTARPSSAAPASAGARNRTSPAATSRDRSRRPCGRRPRPPPRGGRPGSGGCRPTGRRWRGRRPGWTGRGTAPAGGTPSASRRSALSPIEWRNSVSRSSAARSPLS